MYRRLVAGMYRRSVRLLTPTDFGQLLEQFGPEFTYTVAGQHALGGTRRTVDSQRAWFERAFRLLPDGQYAVRDVVVSGWPWRTTVVGIIDVVAPGSGYRNTIIEHAEIRWGRLRHIYSLQDTQALTRFLDRLAAEGNLEAAAAPIDDAVPATA